MHRAAVGQPRLRSPGVGGNTSTGLENPRGPFAGAPGQERRVAKAARLRHLVVQASRCRESARKLRELGHAGEERVGKGLPGCWAPWRGPSRHSAHLYTRQATWLGPSGSDARAEVPSLLTEAAKCWVPCAGPQPRGGRCGALQGAGECWLPRQAARGQCRGRSTLQGDLKKKLPCAAGPREVTAAALVHGRRRENLRT